MVQKYCTKVQSSSLQTDRQIDWQTDRQTDRQTEGTAIPTAKREVVTFGACRRKWRLTDTDLCPCGETQTTSHIVESCPGQNWMAVYLSYTLQIKTLFCGWPVMVHDTHTRRRRILPVSWKLAGDRMRMLTNLLEFEIPQWWWKWNVIWNLYPGPDHHLF